MKKRLLLGFVGCLAQLAMSAQTFSTEFSAEMQRIDGKMDVAPQLKGILELPLKNAWAMEMELASSQSGLDYRIDAKRELGSVVSLLAGASSGDACQVHFADLGMIANIKSTEVVAVLHYAPFSDSKDKYLELTVQRDIRCLYIQPGLYINHADKNCSLTGVLTLGISLDIQ